MNKKLNKYIAVFDYIDKTLIVLFATSGGISIISFVSVIFCKSSCRNSKCKFLSCIFFDYKNNKEAVRNNKKVKKRKHNTIFMLAKSKLNSIGTLIFQALIDLEISHEELKTVVNEKKKVWKYERRH